MGKGGGGEGSVDVSFWGFFILFYFIIFFFCKSSLERLGGGVGGEGGISFSECRHSFHF